MRHLFCKLGAAFMLAACAASPSSSPRKTSVTLLPGHNAALGAATLHFERIDDSRCPPGARCVWAGRLSYHFTLRGGAASETFTLATDAPAYASAGLPGVRVALAPFPAPPPAPSGTPPTPHAVTLNITLE